MNEFPAEIADRRDDVYRRVTRRGRALRRRRTAVVSGVVAIVLAIPVAAVAVTRSGDNGTKIAAVGASSSTASEPSTTLPSSTTAPSRPCSPMTATSTLPPGSHAVVPLTSVPGTVIVPNVLGEPEQQAITQLAQVGLCGIGVRVRSDTVPAGSVVATDPLPNTRVEAGSALAISVSSGPNGATPTTASPLETSTTLPYPATTVPSAVDNQPATISIVSVDPNPRAGQPVKVTVHATDPDARILSTCFGSLSWGDTTTQCYVSCPADVFPPERGEATQTFEHTYDKPGTYYVTITVVSSPCSPYSSSAHATTKIVVQ